MKFGIWLLTAILMWGVGFMGGYAISARTGTEPGYFDAVEAAGYGGGSEGVKGISAEMNEYYKNLLKADD